MAGLHQWPQLSAASESHPHHEPVILPLAFWFPELSVSPPGSLFLLLSLPLSSSLLTTHTETVAHEAWIHVVSPFLLGSER